MQKRKKGQSVVELACGMLVVIPLVLVLFDLTVIVLGVQINDSTCRDAARAAASGPPDSTMTARAAAVVARANNRAGGMVSNFQLVTVTSSAGTTSASVLSYGGTVSGTVTVTTTVRIRPFVVGIVYGGGTGFTFKSQQSFPYTYVYPNTSAS